MARRPKRNPDQLPLFQDAGQGLARGTTEFWVGKGSDVDFRSLRDALRAVPDGATLRLTRGNYDGGLEIEKSVSIIGEKPGTVFISAINGDALVVRGGVSVFLRNLDLHQRPLDIAAREPEARGAALHVVDARVSLEECYLHAGGDAGVVVRGADARLRLLRARIHGCAGLGIWIADEARALIEDSEVARAAIGGIFVGDVASAGWLRMRRTRISRSRGFGLSGLAGRAWLEDCDLVRNGGDGIHARERFRVSLLRGAINDNAGVGIRVEGDMSTPREFEWLLGRAAGGRGRAVDGPRVRARVVSIRGNGLPGARVHGTGARLRLERSVLQAGRHGGVLVDSAGRARIEETDIADHPLAGIWVVDRMSRIELRACQIDGNHGQGIWFSEGAGGSIVSCNVSRNHDVGVQISGALSDSSDGRGVRIDQSRIASNRGRGVFAHAGAQLTVGENEIVRNRGGNLVVFVDPSSGLGAATSPTAPALPDDGERLMVALRRIDPDGALRYSPGASHLGRLAERLRAEMSSRKARHGSAPVTAANATATAMTTTVPAGRTSEQVPFFDLERAVVEIRPLSPLWNAEILVRWHHAESSPLAASHFEVARIPGGEGELLILARRYRRSARTRRFICAVIEGDESTRLAGLLDQMQRLFGARRVGPLDLPGGVPERIEIGARLGFDPSLVAELFRKSLPVRHGSPDPRALIRVCHSILRRAWPYWDDYRQALLRACRSPALATFLEPLGGLEKSWILVAPERSSGLPLENAGADHVFALWFLLVTTPIPG